MAACVCGFPDGAEACRHLLYELQARFRALGTGGDLATWRTLHDVYAVQHEEEFCGRAKGLVAHLGGLCVAIEHHGHEQVYRKLAKLVERVPSHRRPAGVASPGLGDAYAYPPAAEIPAARGTLTIARLRSVDDVPGLSRAIDEWARSTWAAFATLQPVARAWVKDALG